MAEQNFPDNTVYELDNLDVLWGMNSETVDMMVKDPPFNTKLNRAGNRGLLRGQLEVRQHRHAPGPTAGWWFPGWSPARSAG